MLRRFSPFGLFLVVVLVFFGRGLGYALWADDWNYFWLVTHPVRYPIISWLHPGTMFEFHLLYPVLGDRAVLWQLLGIFLKVLAACAVGGLGNALWKSRPAGFIAGVLYAMLPLGLEAMHWPSAHVVLIDAALFCVASSQFLRTDKKTGSRKGVWWAIAAYVMDPLRTLSLIWIPVIYRTNGFRIGWDRRMIAVISGVTAAVIYAELAFFPAYTRWYTGYWQAPMWSVPGRMERFFQTVGQAGIGWFVWLPTMSAELGRSIGNRWIAILGAAMVAALGLLIVRQWGRRVTSVPVIAFAGLWVVSSVFAQWISDPEYIPSVIHRHFAIPAVGIALLLTHFVIRLPNTVRLAVIGVIGIASWNVSREAYRVMDTYRNGDVVASNVTRIDSLIPRDVPAPVIFLDTTDNLFVDADEYRSHMTYHWSKAGVPRLGTFVSDYAAVTDYICREINRGITDPINNVFAYRVERDGMMTEITHTVRNQISSIHESVAQCQMRGVIPK